MEIVLITAKRLAYDTHSLKLEGKLIFALSRCLDTNPYWLHYAADYSWAGWQSTCRQVSEKAINTDLK